MALDTDATADVENEDTLDTEESDNPVEDIIKDGLDEAEESEVSEGESSQNDEEEPTGKLDRPLHEHPRFKEVISKLNKTMAEKEALEAENQKYKASTPTGTEEIKEELVEDSDDDDISYQRLEKQLPKHTFKSGKEGDDYASYDELYKDIRKAVLKDIAAVNQIRYEREQQATEAERQAFAKDLAQIERSLGSEEAFDKFKQFAADIAQQPEFKDSFPDIKMVYATFLQEGFHQSQEQAKKPVPGSKVAKTTKKAKVGNTKLTHKDIHNQSYDDIVDSLL